MITIERRLEGRRILFTADESITDIPSYVTDTFLQLFKQTYLKMFFKEIRIHLSEKASTAIWVSDADDLTIYLSASAFRESFSLPRELPRLYLHEIAHLAHKAVSPLFAKTVKREDALANELLQKRREAKTTAEQMAITRRYYLHVFFVNLYMDGIASFCEEAARLSAKTVQEYTTEKYFNKSYYRAVSFAKRAQREFTSLCYDIAEKKDFGEWEIKNTYIPEREARYVIGSHMVVTLLCFNPRITVEDLMRYDNIQFVRLYEQTMLTQGKTPAVSYTRQKGIFDYQKNIELIRLAFEGKLVRESQSVLRWIRDLLRAA